MDYYIYFHRRLDNNEVFYVGKGKDKRAYVHSSRGRYWKNIVKKYGYLVEFAETGLSEIKSIEREIFWISHFGRRDIKTGCLINFTNGGDGTSGFKQPQHVKDAVSNANRNRVASVKNRQAVASLFKNKTGFLHNRSKKVKCIENGKIYGSQSEAQRELNLGGGSISWAIKNNKQIKGLNFESL